MTAGMGWRGFLWYLHWSRIPRTAKVCFVSASLLFAGDVVWWVASPAHKVAWLVLGPGVALLTVQGIWMFRPLKR